MRSVKDLPNIDTSPQKEPIGFDFEPYLPTGVTLTGTPIVTCLVANVSTVGDSDPASRLSGSPTIGTISPPDGAGVANTAVSQFLVNCQAGVTYLLRCTVNRTDGGVASLWTHMKCNAPV